MLMFDTTRAPTDAARRRVKKFTTIRSRRRSIILHWTHFGIIGAGPLRGRVVVVSWSVIEGVYAMHQSSYTSRSIKVLLGPLPIVAATRTKWPKQRNKPSPLGWEVSFSTCHFEIVACW
jgi:hypothetical protein